MSELAEIIEDYIKSVEKIHDKRVECAQKDLSFVKQECIAFTFFCEKFKNYKIIEGLNASKKGKEPKSDLVEHKGNDGLGISSETSSSSVIE